MARKTSTFPYKRHLGHDKCMLISDGNELNTTMKDITLAIFQVHNSILNSVIISGSLIRSGHDLERIE